MPRPMAKIILSFDYKPLGYLLSCCGCICLEILRPRKDPMILRLLILTLCMYSCNYYFLILGAIMLNEELTHVVLAQSYWHKNSWGFPKGKVNEDEAAHRCAGFYIFFFYIAF